MAACILCGASARDRAGDLKHEACCPHFMRGPDAGGDPYEWPTLLEAIADVDREPCPHCGGDVVPGTTCPRSIACPTCHAGAGSPCRRPSDHRAMELHAARVDAAEELDRRAVLAGAIDIGLTSELALF